jgi:molybdate transport system substrate-binding protein
MWMPAHFRRVIRAALAGLLLTAHTAARLEAQDLSVAAASDLQSALPAIAAAFEKETGRKVAVTFGSSGNFFTQIQNGAPFDVFLSADVDYPNRLEASGHAVPGSVTRYATGRLVLWTRKDSGLDLRRGLRVVEDARVQHIALANPEHAPYGHAAVAALRHERLYEQVQKKFVLGENISQAAQFAQSGNAQVGLIALSLALSPALKSSGSHVDIPEAWYPPIEQAGALLTSSRRKPLARQFLEFMTAANTIRLLRSYGFAIPQAPAR